MTYKSTLTFIKQNRKLFNHKLLNSFNMKNVMTQNHLFKYKFMYYFSRIGLSLVTLIIAPLCWMLSIGNRTKCPPIKNPLLLHSAKKLGHMIRTKEVSCEIIMRAYINRAIEVNKIVNAIVEDRFAQALEEAIEVDRNISNCNKTLAEIQKETPLLGVPITIKQCFMVKGMSSTGGQYNLKCKSDRDSYAVQRIKNAGAIIIALTNTPELSLFFETFNRVTGVTKNPYDASRTVGGSSGGEAALISSGASVIGLGSDIVGSLRLPAFFTGIFSHKPTSKLTSLDGYIPKVHDKRVEDYLVIGPLTRYVEDLPLLMSVLSPTGTFIDSKKIELKNIKVYFMEKENSSLIAKNVDSNILRSMKLFTGYLKGKYDASVEKVDLEYFQYSFSMTIEAILGLEKVETVYLDTNLQFHFWPEFLRFITFRSNSSLPMFCYGIIKQLHNVFFKGTVSPVYEYIKESKKDIEDLLGDNGILLYPTFTAPAHYHYSIFYKVIDISYVSIFNLLGLPVTNCPAGFVDGLPMGFQIVAKAQNDELTLAVAQEAEIFFGGWKPPGIQVYL